MSAALEQSAPALVQLLGVASPTEARSEASQPQGAVLTNVQMEVDGAVVATQFGGGGSPLATLSGGNWLLDCPECVDTSNLENHSIMASDLAMSAVTSAAILDGTILGQDLSAIYTVWVDCPGNNCSSTSLQSVCDTATMNARPIAVSCANNQEAGTSSSCGVNAQCNAQLLTGGTLLYEDVCDYESSTDTQDALVFCMP